MIEDEARAQDRNVDDEHFGAMVLYVEDTIPDALRKRLDVLRPGTDAAELVAVGLDGLRDRITAYVDADISKLVLVPLAEPDDWDAHLGTVGDAVLDLQT